MSEQRIHPAEYSHVPESPETREFVYWHLIDYFGIFPETAEPRPGGKMRGMKHTDTMDALSNPLLDKVARHNETHDQKITLDRATIPKILQELSILGIASASYSYNRIAYFEARLFTPIDERMTDEQKKSAGYKEEHAKEVFKYAPAAPKEQVR